MATATLENCKRDDLSRLPFVQGYGALVAIDRESGIICACSENLAELTGVDAIQALGQDRGLVIGPGDLPDDPLADMLGTEAAYHVSRRHMNGEPVVLISHGTEREVIVDIERDCGPVMFGVNQRIAFTRKLAACRTTEEAARCLLQSVAEICGFDRVLLYKFLPGYDGEVIDEITGPGIEGFLGLRFPAADIPANARRLYVRNIQRAIADTQQATAAVITEDYRDMPDLTFSQLRAVHPGHVGYLENMGVRASFSVSITEGGNLWGLIACHATGPRLLSFEQRLACEDLARIVSMRITDLESVAFETQRLSLQLRLSSALDQFDTGENLARVLSSNLGQIRLLFRADGVWLHVQDQELHDGKYADTGLPAYLRSFIEGLDRRRIYHNSSLGRELDSAGTGGVGGLLYIPFNDHAFLALLRLEQIETVKWAGKPEDIREAIENTELLTPRRSFAVWARKVEGCAEPWSGAEVSVAGEFRDDLTAAVEKQRLARQARQDGLTGVANRVAFDELLARILEDRERTGARLALLLLDLDHFKPVNDAYGHPAGDALLVQVAQRLSAAIRDRDTVARLGGDEFAVIQREIRDSDDAARLAERIVEELTRPFRVEDREIRIGASVGVSLCPEHGTDLATLRQKADNALYRAKDAGRHTYRLADTG
ncbi:MAG: diguanylate cyclase [Gammaproteobacteria bacterium]|nr:diguanylate cyclase [Gammaproteobacteria bacterium]